MLTHAKDLHLKGHKAIKVKPRVALPPPPRFFHTPLPSPQQPLAFPSVLIASVVRFRQEQSSLMDAHAADHERVLPPLQPAAR